MIPDLHDGTLTPELATTEEVIGPIREDASLAIHQYHMVNEQGTLGKTNESRTMNIK